MYSATNKQRLIDFKKKKLKKHLLNAYKINTPDAVFF